MGDTIKSFPPIATPQSRVLILGSMPGAMSLEAQEYYAHPRNSFWKLLSHLFDMPVDTYAQRVKLIKDNHLALWDTLKACERQGSLDSNIAKNSMEANDFAAFFDAHPHIKHVFWNGGTAASVFQKYAMPQMPAKVKERMTFTQLPSTSPAMATKNFAQKLSEWRAVKTALDA